MHELESRKETFKERVERLQTEKAEARADMSVNAACADAVRETKQRIAQAQYISALEAKANASENEAHVNTRGCTESGLNGACRASQAKTLPQNTPKPAESQAQTPKSVQPAPVPQKPLHNTILQSRPETFLEKVARLKKEKAWEAQKREKPMPVQPKFSIAQGAKLGQDKPAEAEERKETFLERVKRLKAEKDALGLVHEATKHKEGKGFEGIDGEVVQETGSNPQEKKELPKHLNEQQRKAIEWGVAGKSFVFTGAAGTGKTFTLNVLLEAIRAERPLDLVEFRDPTGGCNAQEIKPAVACVAFTNRAVNNMLEKARDAGTEASKEYEACYMTSHKLIEFRPVVQDVWDKEKQGYKTVKIFEPQRDSTNKLPIKLLIVEEASQMDLYLWRAIKRALLDGAQIIFVGDLNQLPPVFGDSIMQVALRDLPTLELTHVYRQALDSPIISAAYDVLKQRMPQSKNAEGVGEFKHITFNKLVGAHTAAKAFKQMLAKLYASGEYNPTEDMVLLPFNKHECGTVAMNNHIAHFLDESRAKAGEARMVYEVVSGFEKSYYAVGDRVYCNKMDGEITSIVQNPMYLGTPPLVASEDLTRFGSYAGQEGKAEDLFALDESTDMLFNVDEAEGESEERVRQASHLVEVTLETGEVKLLSTASEINQLMLGYALTCHKAQGCEFNQVFILVHDSQTTVACNEWLYTAITRAKVNCYLVGSERTISRVVERKRIKGEGLDAKREFFIQGLEEKIARLTPEQRLLYSEAWVKGVVPDEIEEGLGGEG